MSAVERLAAVVVNYDSGALAVSCVESLIREWTNAGRARADLTLVVVDNASPANQAPWLARLAALGALVELGGENAGYARAVNRGAERAARHDDHDALAILNPDLLFLPGSVEALLAGLARHPDAGAVGPRTSFDPDGALQLPPNEVPTPWTHWRDTVAQLAPEVGRAAADRRTRVALRTWETAGDLRCEMLSGACLVLPRVALAALGGVPFDAAFPLYFEDTDLCRRLSRRGLDLVRVGDARVCHLWARSSGAGAELSVEARTRFLASRATWYERTHGRLGLAFARAADRVLEGWPAALRHRPIHEFEALGIQAQPVELRLARRAPFVMEVGLDPTLALAGGALGEGDRWRFPASAWEWLFRGPVFCRALDRRDGALLGAWSLHKSTAPRETFQELAPDQEVA